MDREESRLRVFISYSHDDSEIIAEIVRVLQKNGLKPMYDKDFSGGTGFHAQIKSYIAHAHVFMPVITKASRRGWVHQEIGYAMALNIPVLPIVIGKVLPEAMIGELQAIKIDKKLSGLERKLAHRKFQNLVDRGKDSAPALYECARLTEDRAEMLARYSRDVLAMEMTGRVRQKGALSSFHIPTQSITHAVWDDRYGKMNTTTNMFHRRRLSEERRYLAEHAKAAGCAIIVDPRLSYEKYGAEARKTRLQCLLDFLESDEVADVQVALDNEMSQEENVIMVGSYFCAEAVWGAVGQGYRQTIFTRHAPTVGAGIEEFDCKFGELLKDRGWAPQESRWRAAEELRGIISGITP